MPRQPRIEYSGAVYHVMARGNRKEPIIKDNQDRQLFLKTLGQMAERHEIAIHAYVLMSNHYHLMIETPRANLVAAMQWLQTTYTRRFNNRHELWGHLFGGRYKSILIDERNLKYQRCLIDYIHLNPVRAGLVRKGRRLDSYRWSSLWDYTTIPTTRLCGMEGARGFELATIPDDARGRRRYLERLEAQISWESPDEAGFVELEDQGLQSTLRRGWYFGSDEFKDRLLKLCKPETEVDDGERGAFKRASTSASREAQDFQIAEKIIEEGCRLVEIEEAKLLESRKGDPYKALLAMLICDQTSLRQSWISERLAMGVPSYFSRVVTNLRTEVLKDSDWVKTRDSIINNIT